MAIEGYFQFERVVLVLKFYIRFFPLATALLIGIVSTNRHSGDKNAVLSSNSANILAHLIYFLNKRHVVNPPKNPQIRSALPFQEKNYGYANKLAQTSPFRHTVVFTS